MNFNKSTVVALAAMPAAVSSWSCGPTYYSTPLSVRLLDAGPSPAERVRQKQKMLVKRMLDQQQVGYPSNRYHLIDNDEKFQISVDVPGVQEEDIEIKLDDGKLTVQGKRVAASESGLTSMFSQSFDIDSTVDADRFTATLENGVLIVSAPKDSAKPEEKVRRISITPLEDILAEADQNEDDASEVNVREAEVETEAEAEAGATIPVDLPSATKNDTPDDSNDEQ